MPKKRTRTYKKRGKGNTPEKSLKKKNVRKIEKSKKKLDSMIIDDDDEIFNMDDFKLDDFELINQENKLRSQTLSTKNERSRQNIIKSVLNLEIINEKLNLNTAKIIKLEEEKKRVKENNEKIVKVKRKTEKDKKGRYRKKPIKKSKKSKMDEEGLSYPFDNVEFHEEIFQSEEEDPEFTMENLKKSGKMDLEKGQDQGKIKGLKSKKENKEAEKFSGSTFEEALTFLQENYVPDEILCREDEKMRISFFLKNAIKEQDISGVPGLGKTMTLFEVVETLKSDEELKKKFHFIYLNGLKIQSPSAIYAEIYKELVGYRKNMKDSYYYFKYGKFPSGVKSRKGKKYTERGKQVKILVIDELDYLYTKNQKILYNVFDWPHFEKSKLVVIGIANTLDLPDKLTSRISSRLGSQRVIFIPYNSNQIKIIIKQRLKNSKIFHSKAIEFISKKISTISSDIRKTLDFCRTVVNEHMKKGEKRLIKIEDVKFTFERTQNNPFVNFIHSCSEITKIILLSFYNEINQKQKKIVSTVNVYNRFCNILKIEDLPIYTFKEFRLFIDQLFNIGFLSLKGTALLAKTEIGVGESDDYMIPKDFIRNIKACSNGDLVVSVKFELDDIAFALKDTNIWTKYCNENGNDEEK